ncbi:MAG: DUF1214 domain-containing protein [Novosphingobium sp.]|nr:DUF1214 domain-containing protein [Novosphingobium sp.]
MTRIRTALLAAALAGLGQPLAANAQAASAHAAAADPVDAAWARYHATMKQQYDRINSSEFSKDPQIRTQGVYFLQGLQATGFNMYVAPRQQYPALYIHQVFMPFELSWGLPNPDFLYHWTFLDGKKTYRIHGNRKGSRWTTLQVQRGFWGDKIAGTLANVDFDDLPVKEDGSFEIFLGPNPPADTRGQYWVKLEPSSDNVVLNMRETFVDWSKDVPMTVRIETLDRDPDATLNLTPAQLAARIDKLTAWILYNVNFSIGYLNRGLGEDGPGGFWGITDTTNIPPAVANDKARRNRFSVYEGPPGTHGGNPLACYPFAVYDIKPDEALIIEMPIVEARYWGFQLGDIWASTTDYSYHQSSLNAAQARVDKDGVFRAVLSLGDPGVPNWLDPAGIPVGTAQARWYKSEKCVVPTAKLVKLADVRKHLPGDTPVVTPAQRKSAIDVRRAASLNRYGY